MWIWHRNPDQNRPFWINMIWTTSSFFCLIPAKFFFFITHPDITLSTNSLMIFLSKPKEWDKCFNPFSRWFGCNLHLFISACLRGVFFVCTCETDDRGRNTRGTFRLLLRECESLKLLNYFSVITCCCFFHKFLLKEHFFKINYWDEYTCQYL